MAVSAPQILRAAPFRARFPDDACSRDASRTATPGGESFVLVVENVDDADAETVGDIEVVISALSKEGALGRHAGCAGANSVVRATVVAVGNCSNTKLRCAGCLPFLAGLIAARISLFGIFMAIGFRLSIAGLVIGRVSKWLCGVLYRGFARMNRPLLEFVGSRPHFFSLPVRCGTSVDAGDDSRSADPGLFGFDTKIGIDRLLLCRRVLYG
jgi:hypothetical protein